MYDTPFFCLQEKGEGDEFMGLCIQLSLIKY